MKTLKRAVGAEERRGARGKEAQLFGLDEEDVEEEAPLSQAKKKASGRQKKKKSESGPTIEEMMEAMDAELATTKMGEDFERTIDRPKQSQKASPASAPPSAADSKGKDNENDEDDEEDTGEDDTDEEEEERARPVDLNLNLVKNLLESFSSQQGLSGPASNLLASLGLDFAADSPSKK